MSDDDLRNWTGPTGVREDGGKLIDVAGVPRTSEPSLSADVAQMDAAGRLGVAIKRITQLEGDLRIAEIQIRRIDEVLVGSYGDIPRLSASDARRMLRNIAYIVNPTGQLR
jgi:hypothetical protein